jgi:caffeoyl-CoA O-methyltransferase
MADKDSRAGTRYSEGAVIDYTNRVHAPHDRGLDAAFEAPDREGIPAIQVGASEGKLLEMLVRMTGAVRAVEIGTLAGYSAIRIARGLADGGRLWTVENDPRHAEIARANLEAAGVSDRVEVVVGAGLEVLPRLSEHGPFDVVFIDADKGNYDGYGAWAADNLRAGGLLIGDNAFYFGKLLEDDDAAAAMRSFHEDAAVAFETVCIPTPDGMLLGIKK